MTRSTSRNELTDPSLVTLRHSSRQLDIWLISGWHWAHLSLHGNSVRPCFRFGAPSGPLLGRPLHNFSRRPAREWACLLVPLPVLFPSRFITNATVPRSCRALHFSLPHSQSSSASLPPFPCLPAKPAHRDYSPNQPASQPELQCKNKVGNQTALSSHQQPITASSEAAHPTISAYQRASPTLDLLIGRITTPSGISNCERPAS